ncbi:Two component system response regulator/histidine kinase, PAS domain-containing [Desulfonema limicola]|uniref:histidine kinase n=1 Tax=Desulfonema limicola TaxID=45656 RepID=A0A975GIN3_9BACT|nr:PocR ligand-binding domain-containing protein [Desulfonema limicola]QTA82785.1 Two component system response regulator/histidine kinase, PAS domain-containing [Desulfonema limicola]
MKYTFKELVDIKKLQELTDEMYIATSTPSSIITTEGEILTGSGWQRICTDFHRKHPQCARECIESDTNLKKNFDKDHNFVIYECPRGLIDALFPIIIQGEHLANFFVGQVFLKPPDRDREEFFRNQARRFGFNEKEYMSAFREIPVFPEHKLRAAASFLSKFAAWVADTGLARLNELEALEKLRKNEAELVQHQEALEKRIISLTRPLAKDHKIDFHDLFNLQEIQNIQDNFAQISGVASLIISPEGIPITKPSRFCRLCSDIIRKTEKGLKNCHCSDTFIGRYHPDGPVVQTCLSGGLWDAGTSININEQHVASWLIGQVRNEAQDEKKILEYALEIGADPLAFKEAFQEVPVMSKQKFENIAKALYVFAGQLSQMAFYNVQQARLIAEIKASKTEIFQANERLRLSEEKYRSYVSHSPLGIIIADQDGKFTEINKAAANILKYFEDELTGMSFSQIVNQTKHSPPGDVFTNLKETGYVSREELLICKDGSIITAFLDGVFLGTTTYMIFISDRTEQKKLEMQIRQSQKMEAIGVLAGGIAHDFNNILFPIIAFSDMLLDDLSFDSPYRSNVEAILRAALRAGDLVKQILGFSRHEKQEENPLKIQVILKEVLKLIRATLPATIEIEQDIDQECGFVLADPTQIHQIIMNLTINAFHAMQENGGVLTIQLKSLDIQNTITDSKLEPGAYICLKIKDTGTGIEPENLKKIFEPYFTTKNQDKGTGLGLSVVQGIVAKYRGHIQVGSTLGKGSIFEVYFPVYAQENKDKIRYETSICSKCGKEKILLVDDEKDIAQVETQILERLGYKVETKLDPLDALEEFKNHPDKYDLLISDMTMPKMAGDILSSEILKIRPDLPIIICTGFSEKMTHETAELMGIKGLLIKPMIKSEMAEMIRNVLDADLKGQKKSI